MAKSSYQKQFKKGTYPLQPADESTRVNGHEVDSPSEIRKRQGVARGFQTQANPGMSGKQDYTRSRRK